MTFVDSESNGRFSLIANFTETRLRNRNYAVRQNITILRNRVNELGDCWAFGSRQRLFNFNIY